jgi:hypothetical protein
VNIREPIAQELDVPIGRLPEQYLDSKRPDVRIWTGENWSEDRDDELRVDLDQSSERHCRHRRIGIAGESQEQSDRHVSFVLP